MRIDSMIGYREFTDGGMQAIFDARQYVIDNDGYPAYGVWLIPEEVPLPLLIVPADEDKQ